MPIEYKIYHEHHLVVTRCLGVVNSQDFFNYQREAWAKPDVLGYNELVDMSELQEIVMPDLNKAKELALLSAGMDTPTKASRFAIVAVTELQFALGRMYSTWRNSDHRTSKQTQVFRSLQEALDWLGLKSLPRE